jgi:hypothetical protein
MQRLVSQRDDDMTANINETATEGVSKMLRTVLIMLCGVAAGIAATVFLAADDRAGAEAGGLPVAVATGGGNPGESRADVNGDLYLTAYREAVQLDDAADIEARLRELFREPFSIAREAKIGALFQRLAALDLARAIRVAAAPGFDFALIADAFLALAEADAEAALQMLALVGDRSLQLDLAVALLSALGNDASALERIAAALPERVRVAFRTEAIGALAARDPDGALSLALALADSGARNAAAQRVGQAWVHQDPVAAFSMTDRLPNELREAYRDSVVVEWARLDSRDFLAFADTQSTLDATLMGLMHTIGVDPEQTFEVASRHPPLTIAGPFAAYVTVERTSFANAAGLDPERYEAMLEAMPEGQRKQQLAPAFIEILSRVRPREALDRARSTNDLAAEVRTIREFAVLDHELAYEWMEEFYERTGNLAATQSIANNVGAYAATDARRADIAAELLLREDDEVAQLVVNRMLSQWVQSEPETAVDWMLANVDKVDSTIVSTMAGRLASRDAARAASYIDQVPPNLRQSWFEQVAIPYASQDPERAATWLTQFQGEPGYDAVLERVIQQTAQVDPIGASMMLLSAPTELQQDTAASIANGLAADDLAGAARWALNLRDGGARSNAISQVAFDWTYRNPRAAQRWALSLPAGDDRDQALSAMLTRLSRDGYHVAIEAEVLDSFSSEQLRDQQVSRFIVSVANRDPDAAADMLGDWISDPVLREQIEQTIGAVSPR